MYEFIDLHFGSEEKGKEKETTLVAEKLQTNDASTQIQAVSDALTENEGTSTVTSEKEAHILRETATAAVNE